MALERQRYLQPSDLCDFAVSPAIRKKALALTANCKNREQRFRRVFAYVKELPYGLEDWDLKASGVLRKGWGMCSGKTNLLIALLRSVGIPARYRVYRIKADTQLLDGLHPGSSKAEQLKKLGEERDHVDCEVWLGKWIDCDPGRDSAMEKGIMSRGGNLVRPRVTDSKGKVHYLRLANIDDWARDRQKRRTFRVDRPDVFAEINKGFDKLREIGRTC
jgi:hypothetical protein